MITAPGIYPEITPDEYFAGICPTYSLSASGIKILLNETPFDYRYKPSREGTAAMRKGDVVHQLALDKGKGYVISPFDDYRTKEARAWRDAALEMNQIPIKADDYADAQAMAKIIKERIRVALDGADYQTEVPFVWTEKTRHGDVWCTGMMDVWCPELGIVLDPKCTPYVHGDKARNHISNMNWAVQNAWYRRGLSAILPEMMGRLQFKNILILPDEPYTSRVISISEGWRMGAEMDCERALAIYAECSAFDSWPGYPDEEILDEPTWLTSQRMMREMGDD